MDKEQKKKIVKGIILTILLFVVEVIWFHIIIATNILSDPQRNEFLDFVIIMLPIIVTSLLFLREKDIYDSLMFGAVIGFVSGNLFFIYWIQIIIKPGPSADLSLLPLGWIIFILIFTGSCIAGSILSYFTKTVLHRN
jgi:hypothetical protein